MRQKIRIWLRNFFGFSRTEANGFIILLVLMIAILSVPFLSRKIFNIYEKPLQSSNDKTLLLSFLSELEHNGETIRDVVETENLQPFDLNKSNTNELIQAGFPEFLAERIVKYREKVKPFESKAELLKIYGIDRAFYKKIYPFIKITKIVKDPNLDLTNITETSTDSGDTEYPPKLFKKEKLSRFELNQADSLQLQKVYGIGPAYSKRIIKYRDYLGGFHSVDQLKEVYGLKKENIDSLRNYVFIAEELNLRKLKVNELNADSLIQHPYISYKEANLIVNYRNQHGKYNSIEDILAIKILDSTWVKNIIPYLSFD